MAEGAEGVEGVAEEVVVVVVEQPQVMAHGLKLRRAREMDFATELGGQSRWAIEMADWACWSLWVISRSLEPLGWAC